MNSILYEKEITVNAIDSAYEKGKKDGAIEELKHLIDKLEQYRQEELLFHNEERAKYFEEVIDGLTRKKEQSGGENSRYCPLEVKEWTEQTIKDMQGDCGY